MSTKFFVSVGGTYIGGFDGVVPPEGAIEVPTAPADARQVWDGEKWGEVPIVVPDRVTARQFKLQLLASGLLDQVDTWVASQTRAIRIAFDSSGTFARDEPMMQAGFAALGFTEQQVDDFFVAAAAL
jgi:hypothetical protein